MRRPLLYVLSVPFVLALVACSGGGMSGTGGASPNGGTTGSGGTAGHVSGGGGGGGRASGGGAGAGGPCIATATPNTVLPSFTGYSLSVVGQDAYYVDPTANASRGAVRHVMLDGTGDAAIIDPPTGIIFGVSAVGPDLYYFQEDDASVGAVHMYRSPRATGGAGTQVGTDTYNGFAANILGGGLAGIMVGQTFGVFAQRDTDLFVHDGAEISRVSTVTGAKTVIADDAGASGGLLWPALVGSTVFYKDGAGAIYSAPADATVASGARVGTATCGSGRTMWMSSSAAGFLCGELFGLDKVDPSGTTKSHVIYTLMDKNPTQFNPTQIDGTTYYALPKDTALGFPIYKLDAATNTATPVVCDGHAVIDYELTSTDLVYVELTGSTAAISLKRLAR